MAGRAVASDDTPRRDGVRPVPPRSAEATTPEEPVLLEREDEDRAARREVLDLGPQGWVETQDQRAQAAGDRDVLLAVHRIADRAAAMAGAGAEVPEPRPALAVVRPHDPFEVTVEHKVARGGQHAADGRVLVVHGPLALAGYGIARVKMPVRFTARRVLRHLVATEEQAGRGLRDRRLLLDRDLLADLHRGVVPELALRAVGARVPAPPARDPRADERRLAHFPRRIPADELAGLGIDALHPVVGMGHRPYVVDLAVGPIQDEDEAALVLVDEQLLAVTIHDQALAETRVVVPVVVRDLLVVPLELAGVGIEGEHGRRV